MGIRRSIIPARTMSNISVRRISTIPLRANISVGTGGGIGGAGFNRRQGAESSQSDKYEVRPFKPARRLRYNAPMPRRRRPVIVKAGGVKEASLDVFEESKNMLKVVGEFPGINESMEGFVIDVMKGNKLCLISQLSSDRQYRFTIDLPKDFIGVIVKQCEMNNGILVIQLEKGI